MSNSSSDNQNSTDLEFEEGRYLYCVVSVDEAASFSMEGIEGGNVSMLTEEDLGAIIQPVESVFDSDDMTRVRRWLLTHQNVVDTVGNEFGTPLPFRFDTIFTGGDEVVSEWLRDNYRDLAEALDWLAGRWEYRIDVRWSEELVSEQLRHEDDQLQQLATRIEEASSGTGYLLESQYEQRLSERLQARSEQLEARLVEDIEPYVVEIERSGGHSTVMSQGRDSELDSAVKLSVLADRNYEEAIGEELESLAAQPHYDVRYTGPWPPYSHAPDVGGDVK